MTSRGNCQSLLGVESLLGTAHGGDQRGRDHVGIGVSPGPPVLKIAMALGRDRMGDPDRRAAMGDAPVEGVDVAGLVEAGQALVQPVAVMLDVSRMARGQLLDGDLDAFIEAYLRWNM